LEINNTVLEKEEVDLMLITVRDNR